MITLYLLCIQFPMYRFVSFLTSSTLLMCKLGNFNQYLINHIIRCTCKSHFLSSRMYSNSWINYNFKKGNLWVGTVNMNIKGLVGHKGG